MGAKVSNRSRMRGRGELLALTVAIMLTGTLDIGTVVSLTNRSVPLLPLMSSDSLYKGKGQYSAVRATQARAGNSIPGSHVPRCAVIHKAEPR